MRRMGDAARDAERESVAAELRRVREAARDAAGALEPAALPPPREPDPPAALRPLSDAAAPAAGGPRRPDAGAVSALSGVRPATPGSRLARLVRRLLGPSLEAQAAFNARQAQLDGELLDYVDARLDVTHRHYDHVLGLHGRRMNEIDERHVLLQRDVVSHVHDLVKRIDLVLSEAERGQLSLEAALRDVRARLLRIEERLHGG
jgi:hypothetical protein